MKRFTHVFRTQLSTQLTLLDQVLVSGSNFLIGILLTRWLGLEDYGIFALAWLGLQLASGLQLNYVLKPMMSLGPKMPAGDRQNYLATTQLLNLIFVGFLTLLAFGGGIVGGRIWPEIDIQPLFPVLPLGIMAYLLQDYYRRLFYLQDKPLLAFLLDTMAYGGMILGMGLCYGMDCLSVRSAYAILLITFTLSTLVGYALADTPSWQWVRIKETMLSHWRFSSWLVGTAALQFFGSNFFLVAAGGLLGASGVGALRIAQNLMGLTHILFQAMENVVPIRAATALSRDGIPGMIKYLRIISAKAAAIIGLILLGVALSAEPLLSRVYGQDFVGYGYLLVAYCGFYATIFPGYPLRFALRSIEYTQPIFWAYVISALFSLSAAYPMVEAWGLLGVVYGLIVTQLLMQGCYVWMLRRRLGVVKRAGTYL